MNDPIDGPDRSITFYAAAEREQRAASTEAALTTWAVVALLFVVLGIMLGGCA